MENSREKSLNNSTGSIIKYDCDSKCPRSRFRLVLSLLLLEIITRGNYFGMPPLKNCSFVSIFILPSETSLTCFIIRYGIVAQTAFSILQTQQKNHCATHFYNVF